MRPLCQSISARGTVLLLAVAALSNGGCIALNIPSVRYHESEPVAGPRTLDKVLLFSPTGRGGCDVPSAGGPLPPATGNAAMGSAGCALGNCGPEDASGGPHGCGPQEPGPKLPEVPWPRFHPVPTSPVFGG
ncbi:hypothetical protein [Roseimaritima sediminicola]|uniref:hypothetical protein n=1 Tax=Roseimaritima sediminicola TaxID=2662066 RepID=UPI0012985888|nr:hypothetical protein [Roseimaritima sediminicola]